MTRSLLLLLPLLALAACADGADDAPAVSDEVAEAADFGDASEAVVGDAVPGGDALSPDALIADAEEYAGRTIVVEGTVREVCQQAGCWLSLVGETGETIRVDVPRDETESYVFTFPKDASGRTARIAGTLEVRTESVADQRHYAEDGGASPEEVAAITEPKRTLVLTALGAELAPATPEASA